MLVTSTKESMDCGKESQRGGFGFGSDSDTVVDWLGGSMVELVRNLSALLVDCYH